MSDPRQRRTRAQFRPDEDAQLRQLVMFFGDEAWASIAAHLPGRNPRQCRDRWHHYLCNGPAQCVWSAPEDRLLFQQVHAIGPKWRELAAFFPGKTEIQIKTRWMQAFAPWCVLHRPQKAPRPAHPPPAPKPIPAPETETAEWAPEFEVDFSQWSEWNASLSKP
jgi:hypothetical protein